jgi:hypothetical protein
VYRQSCQYLKDLLQYCVHFAVIHNALNAAHLLENATNKSGKRKTDLIIMDSRLFIISYLKHNF